MRAEKWRLKPWVPLKKELSPAAIYKKSRPHVYRLIKAFINEQNGRRTIGNVTTAFSISEEGHFVVNQHRVELWEAGSGHPEKVDRSVIYFLADYDGNILSIDSVCTYDELADVAIIKANTNGKKITAFL